MCILMGICAILLGGLIISVINSIRYLIKSDIDTTYNYAWVSMGFFFCAMMIFIIIYSMEVFKCVI